MPTHTTRPRPGRSARLTWAAVCSAALFLTACGGDGDALGGTAQDAQDASADLLGVALGESPLPLTALSLVDTTEPLLVPSVRLASDLPQSPSTEPVATFSSASSPVSPVSEANMTSMTSTALLADPNTATTPSSVWDSTVSAANNLVRAMGFTAASATLSSAPVPVASVQDAAVLSSDPGALLLLLPDGQDMADPGVAAWLDAAAEVGVRMQAVSDAQFLAMGDAALGFAGLVLPDSLHVQATDGLLLAIERYTQNGGQTLLVFDFGALTTTATGVPVYPVPQSRLSALAGVSYVLYDELRDRTTGLGPVTATRSTLRALQVPPGKSLPLPSQANSASAPLLSAAQMASDSALYLPVSVQDAGGVRGFDVQQYSQQRHASSTPRTGQQRTPRALQLNLGRAFKSRSVDQVTQVPQANLSRVSVADAASVQSSSDSDPVEAYSGYLLGPLIYPSYVTRGDFGSLPGQQTLATSPQFGLVAGVNPVGAGRVLFVNLPLTYLKGRTDALMMHGFLHYFARQMLGMAHLSAMPNGVGGMTFDWHLDAKAAQAPTDALMKLNVFNDPQALFSIEMTAGPDAIVAGDGLGWNLPRNKKAQQFLQTFNKAGHSVGSHGGWNHDFYGALVSETNALESTGGACVTSLSKNRKLDNFFQCLVLNRNAVDAATGQVARSYSSPEGNNPMWSMDWHEQQGVVSAYFAGHTGLGATRQYREGRLLNPKLWVFPVTPAGLYATYEEFQDYNVPQSEVIAWKRAMIDFGVTHNTSRMIYAHPPGAYLWRNVLQDMLSYAKSQGPQFAWYTMERLADFNARRLQVSWQQSLDAATGQTLFTATHPSSLQEMVWRLPKSRYPQAPVVVSGDATVDSADAQYWRVRATGGTRISFRS